MLLSYHIACFFAILPEKPRLIWNGTSKRSAHEVAMNDITPTENEAQITFGYVFMAFMIWIYNLRISFPDEEILLAFMDITACFRWPRINPDLVGAFGFLIGAYYFAANAMVFGSVASASSWEPFRRAIECLAAVYFANKSLAIKHKYWLDMIRWADEPGPEVAFTKAKACTKNKGILDSSGTPKPTPHFIYVDDDLLADTRSRMYHTLAAGLKAIFDLLGWPALLLRQCAVSLQKWRALEVMHCIVLLGLVFDTRAMTVGITTEYRQEVIDLMESDWNGERDIFFTVPQIEKLIGKLGRIGQAFRPIYHLMPHLYSSVAYALRDNKSFLVSTSAAFRKLIKTAKRSHLQADNITKQDIKEINFAVGQASRRQHRCDKRYKMPISLRRELALILRLLKDKTILLCTPFAHIVPREENFETACDSCKEGGGGWSTDLTFWWHIAYKREVVRRAYLPNNKHGLLVSINSLEFFCVIVNFAAAICALAAGHATIDDVYPVLLNWCDNISACAWVNSKCKESLIGRRLALVFVGLLLNSNMGIQAEYLNTVKNFIADDISRLRKIATDKNSFNFDYAKLLSTYPEQLTGCKQFHPSELLLSTLYDVLLNNVSPDPLTIKQWTPEMLGRFGS